MKKCMKCNLLFELEERTRCLYCNTLLTQLDPEETNEYDLLEEALGEKAMEAKRDIIAQMIKDRRVKSHNRMQYIIGSYFRTRTFHFMYCFSRNEFKMGKGFSRFMVQPFNTSHFFIIPWVFIDIFDSLWLRLTLQSYCKKCGWKFSALTGPEHDPKKCDYCREYSLIIDDILTGRVTQTERVFKKQSLEKLSLNQRSAYHDLCSQKKLLSSILDVLCVWFSISLMLALLVYLSWPLVRLFLRGLDIPDLHLR